MELNGQESPRRGQKVTSYIYGLITGRWGSAKYAQISARSFPLIGLEGTRLRPRAQITELKPNCIFNTSHYALCRSQVDVCLPQQNRLQFIRIS
ncbi:fumarate reductase [Pyricularia oryzae]|nr:fumarate reductase [Pyricularia oryzae]KAI7926008.1 fumarate reductase [Pyricularia oryzae]